jgi:hypothetical protein
VRPQLHPQALGAELDRRRFRVSIRRFKAGRGNFREGVHAQDKERLVVDQDALVWPFDKGRRRNRSERQPHRTSQPYADERDFLREAIFCTKQHTSPCLV